jgi:hypothetical protein
LQTFSQKRTKKIFSAAAEASGSVFQKVSGNFFSERVQGVSGSFFSESFFFREFQRAPYYLSLLSVLSLKTLYPLSDFSLISL